MVLKFNPVKKGLLSAKVEQQLKAAIEGRVFTKGEKIPSEQKLAQQFQVSRSTIREALSNLKSMGLLEIRRGINAGAYVSEPTSESMTKVFSSLIGLGKVSFSQIIEVRLHIEPSLAWAAATKCSEEDFDKLEEIISIREKTISRIGRRHIRKTNIKFHLELARIVGNPVMVFLMEAVTNVYYESLIDRTVREFNQSKVAEHISQHKEIFKCLINRDADGAHRSMAHHIVRAYYSYAKVISEYADPIFESRVLSEYLNK